MSTRIAITRTSTRLFRGLAVAGAATCLLASSVSAATTEVEATDDKTFVPGNVTSTVGGSVHWFGTAGSEEEHSVVSDDGVFSSGSAVAGLDFTRTFSAGTFAYHCGKHGLSMSGRVGVAPQVISAPRGLPFTIRWAATGTNTGSRFDVDYRIGRGPWKAWMRNTAARSQAFGTRSRPVRVRRGKVYSFRVRSGTGSVKSALSPVRRFRAS